MLKTLGIETRLQLAITICVVALVFVSPLGGSGGAPPVFFTYRTLLLVITVLCTIGSLRQDFRISPVFLSLIAVNIVLALISVLRIPGSHFSGMYLWYRHTFFISAFLALALYSRYQSARWRGTLLGTVVFVNLIHLVPDLLLNRRPVAGFSTNNANYFATFMLIGMAASLLENRRRRIRFVAVVRHHPNRIAWRNAGGRAGCSRGRHPLRQPGPQARVDVCRTGGTGGDCGHQSISGGKISGSGRDRSVQLCSHPGLDEFASNHR